MDHRYYREDVTEYAFRGDDRRSTHGLKVVISNEDRLEDPEASFQDIISSESIPTSRFNDAYVQRLGLCEICVLILHINSYSFRRSVSKVRGYLRTIFFRALWSQVDF